MNSRRCPPDTVLKKYLLGRVSESNAIKIERHLNNCKACQKSLETLNPSNDSLIEKVKSSLTNPETLLFEKENELENALRAIADFSLSVDQQEKSPNLDAFEFIRDYQVIKKLGEGGMGRVYLAKHTKLDKHVAIKILHSDRLNDAESISRFQREMKAVGRLEHPNIIRAMDAGEERELHFLVTEFVKGVDLSIVSRQSGTLNVSDACELIRQAALGLAYAHECDLVHRDIKPSNLMLSSDGTVKLLDLGLAQLCHRNDDLSGPTQDGQLVGTLNYMAPEQIANGSKVDFRCDIYGLGATLRELIYGRVPPNRLPVFPSLSGVQELRTDVPDPLNLLISQMMALLPADRIDNANLVAEQLQNWTEQADLQTVFRDVTSRSLLPTNSTPTDERQLILPVRVAVRRRGKSSWLRKTRPPWKWISMALAIGLISVGVFSLWPGKDKPPPPPSLTKGVILINTDDSRIEDLIRQKLVVATNEETGASFVLVKGENELTPGVHTIRLTTNAQVLGEFTKFKVVIAAGKTLAPLLEFSQSPQIDFTATLPQIPDVGDSVKYSCNLRIGKQADPVPYSLEMSVLAEEAENCWLQLSIKSLPNWTETATVLINKEKYNRGESFEVIEGWIETGTPEYQTQLRKLAGDRLVVPFEADRDHLQLLANKWQFSWPTRLSTHKAMVLLFDAHCAVAGKKILFIREQLGGGGDLEFESVERSGPRRKHFCWLVTRSEKLFKIARTKDSKDVPFSFVNVDIDLADFALNLSLAGYSKTKKSSPINRSDFEAMSQRLAAIARPALTSFMYASIPDRPGSWVHYVGQLGQQNSTIDVKLTALNGEEIDGRPHRWIRIVSGVRASEPIVATLLVDEQAYTDDSRFVVHRGWLTIRNEVFEFKDGDMEPIHQSLAWLDKSAATTELSVQKVLTLLFDAKYPDSGALGTFRSQFAKKFVEEDRYRFSEPFIIKSITGKDEPGLAWHVKFPTTNLEYRIERSENIPFGIGRALLKVPGIVELATDLSDFGWDANFDPVDTNWYMTQVDETRKHLQDKAGVRNWTVEKDSKSYFGKFVMIDNGYALIRLRNGNLVEGVDFTSLSKDDRNWIMDLHKRVWRTESGHRGTGVFWGYKSRNAYILIDSDGEPIEIPKDDLSEDDQAFVEEQRDRLRLLKDE